MDASSLSLIGLGLTVIAALLRVRHSNPPLRIQCRELCGHAERKVTVILTPDIVALLVEPPPAATPVLAVIINQFALGPQWSGLSVLMLDWTLGRFMAKTPIQAPLPFVSRSGSGW